MTLICAMKCNDGIVLGSDGQASANTVGGSIKHQIQKIYQVGKESIFIGSGTIGLIQKSLNVINNHSEELADGLNYNSLESIKAEVFPIIKNARDSYIQYYNKSDGAPAIDFLLCGMDEYKNLRMWHFGPDSHDEFIDVVGCYCSGSGETFGYSLLKSLMQSSSNIRTGKLIVYRTIRDTINAMASGVGYPIDIWYIKSDLGVHGGPNSRLEIHRISNDEMEELSQLYKSWKKIDADFLAGNMELG